MRKLYILVVLAVTFFIGIAVAEIDLSDFDDDVMRTMDDTNKYLEPDINGKNAKSALEGVDTIAQGLKWTEEYFVHKGGVDDGVKLAKDGLVYTSAITAALNAGDFDKAAASARALTKNCRSCHDLYKPLTK